jgi:hypothetical protein
MITRRDLVGKVAVGAAVILTGSIARASYRGAERQLSTPTGGDLEGWRVDESAAFRESSDQTTSVPNPCVSGAKSDVAPLSEMPPPWELIRPLELGSTVAFGWTVAGLTGAVDGSAVVTLQNKRGRSHRVHICRNDGRPQGLVYTRRFDLVVMNGGRGDLPTEEGFARAVAELGHVLATNENDPRQGTLVASLLPQAERLRRFDDARLR